MVMYIRLGTLLEAAHCARLGPGLLDAHDQARGPHQHIYMERLLAYKRHLEGVVMVKCAMSCHKLTSSNSSHDYTAGK